MQNKLIILGLVLVSLYFSRGKILRLINPPNIAQAMKHLRLCEGKKICAIIYVAPWCPACNQMLPEISRILQASEGNPDHEVVVIVGKGADPIENNEKALEIGPLAITDNRSVIHDAFKIDRYPTFMLVNSQHQIVSTDQEAYIWMAEHF